MSRNLERPAKLFVPPNPSGVRIYSCSEMSGSLERIQAMPFAGEDSEDFEEWVFKIRGIGELNGLAEFMRPMRDNEVIPDQAVARKAWVDADAKLYGLLCLCLQGHALRRFMHHERGQGRALWIAICDEYAAKTEMRAIKLESELHARHWAASDTLKTFMEDVLVLYYKLKAIRGVNLNERSFHSMILVRIPSQLYAPTIARVALDTEAANKTVPSYLTSSETTTESPACQEERCRRSPRHFLQERSMLEDNKDPTVEPIVEGSKEHLGGKATVLDEEDSEEDEHFKERVFSVARAVTDSLAVKLHNRLR